MKLSTLTMAVGLAVSGATASAQGVTDPQLASIVVTANQATSMPARSPRPVRRMRM